jgi:hypothetical protein
MNACTYVFFDSSSYFLALDCSLLRNSDSGDAFSEIEVITHYDILLFSEVCELLDIFEDTLMTL